MPDYIKRLVTHNRTRKKAKGKDQPLLDKHEEAGEAADDDEIVPDVEITEAKYRENPLAADVRYWGHWLLMAASKRVGHFYPPDSDGSVPIAYLWARTVRSPSPSIRFSTPLLRHTWLTKKPGRNVAFKIVPDSEQGLCEFVTCQNGEIDFDPNDGTMKQGRAVCVFSQATITNDYLQSEGKAGRLGEELTAVVLATTKGGRKYRSPTSADRDLIGEACRALQESRESIKLGQYNAVPDEAIPPTEIRRLSVPLYGLDTFGKLFTPRQLNTLIVLASLVRDVVYQLPKYHDADYALAVAEYLALVFDRILDRSSTACIWHTSGEKVEGSVGRHTLPMTWDFAETNPINGGSGNIEGAVAWITKVVETSAICSNRSAIVKRGLAQQLPSSDFDAVVTDPPYYDSVPYSHLADFFYVWLKRILGDRLPDLFKTPLCPKGPEIVQDRPHRLSNSKKTKEYFEQEMGKALTAARCSLGDQGVLVLLYAHKTTAAWETLVQALLRAGLTVSASWPLHTEMTGGMVKTGKAVLASSIFLVCRKRRDDTGDGLWDDVRKDLRNVAQERLDFFWSQGIRGADFFISAIGPALSVFGSYQRVIKLSGEEIVVNQFLDEVRSLVTEYALSRIMQTTQTATIDPESRFYVIWKWSYGNAVAPADESFKLAQALGMATETMWDRTGILEKSGENVQALPIAKRMKIKDLGDSGSDGTPGSLIDVLHRLCVFREKNDTDGMGQFLARSGQGNNSALWVVAQAMSDILPDGDKEKQLMQGLLNQKEKLEQATEQGRLF